MVESAAAKPEIPVRQGDVLDGKYRVDSVLGIGGMGAVLAATHLQLAQKVAIKLLLSTRSDKDEIERLHRLLNEARVVAKMKSPHIARVLDVGTLDNGGPYMVMELLEGTDLERHLEDRGTLPVDMAVDYVLQACEAVAEAHHMGVVHRDLKPSNLFLTRSVDKRPMIKVLDFGLSKSVRGDKSTSSITRPLEIVGTPSYMSPEQLRSTRDVDERTDIWSLGVILYELVSGTLPFDNTSIPDLCAAIVRDPPRTMTRQLPTGIIETIERCLKKNPDERFRDIAELAKALAPFAPDDERSERIVRVRQETSPDLVMPDARTSQRLDRERQNILEEDEDIEEDAPPKRRGAFGIFLAILLVAAGGAGAGFLFIEVATRVPKPATQAQAPPPVVTAEPPPTPASVQPIVSVAPTPAPPSAAPAVSTLPFTTPSGKVDPKIAGMRPLKPRPQGKPGPTATTGETPTAPPTTNNDPNRFFETR